MSDFGTSFTPVARKDHRCAWCGHEIVAGMKYYRYTGMFEGEFQNWAMHLECEEAYRLDDPYNDGFSMYDNERPTKTSVPAAAPIHTVL